MFGPVASTTTAWRCLKEIDAVQLGRIERARARTRAWAWEQIVARNGRIPPARTWYGGLGKTIVVRLDASIVLAHSDKAGAKGTFKGTYGHHPLLATCDNTGELLVALLREGNAGSNTGTDHIKVLDAAITQIPWPHRRDLLVTIDGAGAGHQIVDHITAWNARHGYTVQYSVGFDLDDRARTAISKLPAGSWEPALDPDGKPRDDAAVAELTGLLHQSVGPDGQMTDQLHTWPDDLRVIVHREPIPAGMQVSPFEQHDGYRYQLLATNTTGGQPQRLEARHLTLDGDLAKAEPKTLRYRLLHTAARITHGQHRHWLNTPPDWPWATQLATAVNRVMALPAPT